MNVSACLVTRGDVDMQPVLESLPPEWETVVWDNGAGRVEVVTPEHSNGGRSTLVKGLLPDVSVYGRYAAVACASCDLIFVCDDDVIVSDPQAIVDAWLEAEAFAQAEHAEDPLGHLVCNMPQEFRPHYPDAALVGFGAAFHRDTPGRVFDRFYEYYGHGNLDHPTFNRECDRVFTVLTPRVLVDVPKEDREFAGAPGRLYREPGHNASTKCMLDLARKVRDAN